MAILCVKNEPDAKAPGAVSVQRSSERWISSREAMANAAHGCRAWLPRMAADQGAEYVTR